jgi:predicted ATP-grasp superfamily ATP-dependent carboligase
MPSVLHVRSPDIGAAILIAASSARALAGAARRAGFRPLAADFFDDLDTRAFCAANSLIEGGLEKGFTREMLLPVLEALAGNEAPCGFIYGAGFEDRPELLELVARRFTVLGNRPDVVRRVKDPMRLAALCAALNIPHPKISMEKPRDPRDWLVKWAGGAGGSHVAPALAAGTAGEKIYFQRMTAGAPVSILFVADGAKARVIGLSRQWAAPAPGEPFRFGGSLRPAGVSRELHGRLRRAAKEITAACGLCGLNSIDFLIEGSDYTLIEINPRPGATLDIFDDCGGALFRAHVDACRGYLPPGRLGNRGAAAAGIAYARRDISAVPDFDWPEWTADRQKAQSQLRAEDPLCTIKARAAKPARARALLDRRTKAILGRLDHAQNEKTPMGKETAQ